MIEKEFTLYPEAFELNQLGFDEPCFKYIYTGDTGNNVNIPCEVLPSESKNYNEDALCVSTPTYSQAFRWFREKHNLFSFITTIEHADSDGFDFTFWIAKYNIDKMPVCSTYEEAELACLKEMIKIIKNK